MRYLREALRMIFVSVETLYVLIILSLVQFYPKLFEVLGDCITGDAEIKNWLPVIPLGVSAYCFLNLMWKLITPLDGSNSELHEWPDFWRLQMRAYYSLILSVICAAGAVVIWIFSKTIPHLWIGIVFSLALGISLINVGCMIFASYTIRIIMESKQQPSRRSPD